MPRETASGFRRSVCEQLRISDSRSPPVSRTIPLAERPGGEATAMMMSAVFIANNQAADHLPFFFLNVLPGFFCFSLRRCSIASSYARAWGSRSFFFFFFASASQPAASSAQDRADRHERGHIGSR
jgi:hypothetical protein